MAKVSPQPTRLRNVVPACLAHLVCFKTLIFHSSSVMSSVSVTTWVMVTVAVMMFHSLSSGLPITNYTHLQITNGALRSRVPRSLPSLDLFALPCHHGDRRRRSSRSTGYGKDPRILICKMQRIMDGFNHCYGYGNMAEDFMMPTKLFPKRWDDEGKAVTHKVAITLQMLSHYMKRFQMSNHESFYNDISEIIRDLSCALLSRGHGLPEDDLLPFVQQQLSVSPEHEPSKEEETLFCNYHTTFAKAAIRSMNVWKHHYDLKKCS